MPKCSLTLEFASVEEATTYLSVLHNSSVPITNAKIEPSIQNQQTTAAQVQQTSALQATQAAPQGGDKFAPIGVAYQHYVAKGGGRTAITAKAILQEFGLSTYKNATDEQIPLIIQAFETR